MKNSLIIIVYLLILTFQQSCKFEKQQKFDKENIELKVEIQSYINRLTHEKVPISLKDNVSLSFDTLFIFKPYTLVSEIKESVSVNLSNFELIHDYIKQRGDLAIVEEGFTLLIFVKNGKAACYVNFPREVGDFSKVTGYCYSANHTNFFAEIEGATQSSQWTYIYNLADGKTGYN